VKRKALNALLIVTDSQSKRYLGCYGNTLVDTPHTDRLAARGVRFARAYASSPICAPTRASLIAGRYVHELRCWDNASPYAGDTPDWSRFFRDRRATFVSFGRHDFAPGAETVPDERLPETRDALDIVGLFRDEVVERSAEVPWRESSGVETDEDPGDVADESVAAGAERWLREEAPGAPRPWLLWVEFQRPHSPFRCRKDLFEKYLQRAAACDALADHSYENLHPINRELLLHCAGGDGVSRDVAIRARAGYMGLCEQVDEHVGRVLAALAESGQGDETLVVYLSDHGELLGAHGLWGKFSMYEESASVPLIVSGPGLRRGAEERWPASQLDVFPTIAEAMGYRKPGRFRGRSLLDICARGSEARPERYVFCEYHANGSTAGVFMLCDGRWKAVFSPKYPPMLFDLDRDPLETTDLCASAAPSPAIERILQRFRQALDEICDMNAVDAAAKADQKMLREMLAESGRLYREQEVRGFRPNKDRLVNADPVWGHG